MTERESARRVREMFAAITPSYDLLNRVLSAGVDQRWRRRAARSLALPEGAAVLDLCGGTADLAIAFAGVHSSAFIVIADFCEPMLHRAAAKTAGRERFAVTAADALLLPFPDASFDAVACAFGLRNLVDIDLGLREIRRVLRPGGAVRFLEFMGGRRTGLGRLTDLYFRQILPRVGRAVSKHRWAYDYLPDSARRFLGPDELEERMRGLGFEDVRCRPLTFGLCHLFSARAGQ